jgi:flavodoxin
MLPVKGILLFAATASIMALLLFGCASSGVDATSAATTKPMDRSIGEGRGAGGVLIILASSPGHGTSAIGEAIADRLGAAVASPEGIDPEELGKYSLVGFGSGIFDQAHHLSLLAFAERLPFSADRKVFIFSTSGVSRRFALDHGIDDPHDALRSRLRARGCAVVGEFNCVGFNDNSFLKLFGGMNKGRPNQQDIDLARAFAGRLEESL